MDQELIEAIVACNLPLVRMLLTAGANPNAQRDGKSAYQLVPSDCTDIKCLLIEAGADDPLMMHDLGWAIAVERPEIAKLLIEQGADLNVSTGAGTPLRLAASKGMADLVDALLAAGADPDGSTHPNTALQSALENRHADIALKLLAAGVDPNLTSPWGRIPAIALAAAHGLTEVVQALLDAGADVNITVREMTINRAELQEKVRAGLKSIQAVMEIIGQAMQLQEESEADEADSEEFEEDDFEDDFEDNFEDDFEDELEDEADFPESVDTAIERMKLHSAEVQAIEPEVAIDVTPVILAARCGHAEVLRLLLAAGADPNCQDGTGLSAYDWGIKHEHPQVLAALRQAGVDSTQADPDQHLITAAEQGDVEAIEEWLLRGAQVNARDRRRNTRNFTPLMLAAANGNLAAVNALIGAGADVNLTDRLDSDRQIPFCLLDQPYEVLVAVNLSVNVTPLILAARKGYTPVVKTLIEHNADFSINDPMNQNAIAVATLGGHIEVVKVLIAAGMPFDQPDVDGDTPLMIALLKENRSLSLFFLDLEVNVNWRNEQNETPLMKAADFGNVEVLQRLLDKGADLHTLSDEQENALSIAISSKREAAVEFLQQQGATLPPESAKPTEVTEEKAEQNWGDNLVQPDFSEAAQNPNYIKAVQELAARCGSEPVSWHGVPGWFEIHVHSKYRANINTDEIQREFLERGCFVYEPMVYTSDEPEKLRILPTTDKYEAIALNQTYDCVNKIDPEYMMQWLRELEQEQPFTITWINKNIVGGKFLTPIVNPPALAKRIDKFCPNIVEKICDDLDDLAQHLATKQQFHFWWD